MTPDELNQVIAQIDAELDAAAEPLRKAYKRLLRGAGRHMARKYHAQAVSLTAAGFIPPDGDEVVPFDLSEKVGRATDRARQDLIRRLLAAFDAHEIPLGEARPFVSDELLEKVGARASFATEQELRDIYRDVIQTAVEHGFSIPRTAAAIVDEVDGVAEYRATALARTDVLGLMNGATHQAATKAFAERDDVNKIWLATNDERTRETHADADGQEVGINDFFTVGDDSLMYPGDPGGSDEEVINCRCTLIYAGAAVAEQALAASTIRPGAYSADMTDSAATAAVTITVDDNASPALAERARTPWEGILAIEGSPTSDGRYLIPGEIDYRDLPLPIAPSHEKQSETETAGRIETLERIPIAEFDKGVEFALGNDYPPQAVVIWGEGTFDGSPEADDAQRQIENGVGISLDLPLERRALIHAETYEEVDPTTLDEEIQLGLMLGVFPEGYLRGMAGKIGGASLASIAAFEEASIRIVDDHVLVASGFAIREREDPFLKEITEAMIASIEPAPPLAPPREWFYREEADEPTPITIRPSGEFYGHMALWNTCHAGRANGAYSACMYAPHSRTNYAHFHLGAMLCDDGAEVSVGRITIGTGHAPLHLGAAAARKHYDHTGTVVGFCRAHDGVFGIWVSGVIKSDATPEQIRDFRACPPSGDWRREEGNLELQAALAVNVAGFPVTRSQLALSASAESLDVATLILGPPDDEDMAEALRAEYALAREDDVNMLVELTFYAD